MGNLFCYREWNQPLGDCSKSRWEEAKRLLPLLIEFLNERTNLTWSSGQYRNVVISDSGTFAPGLSDGSVPASGVFSLDAIIRDESEIDWIVILDADELLRLFRWCAFLDSRDGAFIFYAELVNAFKSWTRGIENFASQNLRTESE